MQFKSRFWCAIGVWLVMLLSACGGGSGGPPTPPSGLSYPAPASIDVGAAVQWSPTVTGNVSAYAVAPALPGGLALDAASGVISGAATAAADSASYVVTASNAGGSTTATLTFAVHTPAIGPAGEVKVSGTTEAPVLALSSTTPASGETVKVDVNAAGATQIDLAAQGSGCGALASASAGGATLTQSGAVAADGQCRLTALVKNAAGTTTYTAEFTVVPSAPLAAQGLSIDKGTYFPSGDASLLPASTVVAAGAVDVPQALVNGGHASIFVTQTGRATATRALVRFSQVPGYYLVPLTWDASANAYRIDLQASADFVDQLQAAAQAAGRAQAAASRGERAVRALSAPRGAKAAASRHAADVRAAAIAGTTLTVTVSPVGPDGGLGVPASATLPVQAVGSGPIQVSLSWVGPVDVDLHVTPPSGEDIYWANQTDATGGTLDLDSNAGCAIDNVNVENIVWSNSTTPSPGHYEVRVDYWSNCGISTPIPYTVRVTNCGVATTYSGVLQASQADEGSAGSGNVVATFEYTSCSGLSVAGTARYDDYAQTPSGLSSTARPLPIRYAQVEVHQSADDSVLATGKTDENGKYALTFSMATPGKYYVKVLAAQGDLAWLPQKVVNTAGAIYAIRTPDQDASVTPNATGIDLNAKRGESFAEAFNIFDLGVLGFKEAQSRLGGATLPALTWRWTAGQATCGGSASCYAKSDDSIYVLSTAADADEYDDTVLAHEFGHFVMHHASRDDSPGGSHGLNQQNVPTLAWSEGVASFIGQRILQTPTYIDTNANGTFSYNVETLPSYVPAGTSDGTPGGNLSEALVTAVLWDLADSASDSKLVGGTLYTDTIANPDAAYAVLQSWVGKTHDRGATGADLVDYLDEWLCTITTTTWDATPGDNLNGLITKLNGFPYAPAATPNCQ
jgi:hypothetical protein